MLRNTLGRWLGDRGFAGSFDLQRRAEEVTVNEYLALAAACATGTLPT
jgi:16S rRNA (adenine1518-N6/adenine1519-N6)-dimethyltransferase